jgi:hypothetical protein
LVIFALDNFPALAELSPSAPSFDFAALLDDFVPLLDLEEYSK